MKRRMSVWAVLALVLIFDYYPMPVWAWDKINSLPIGPSGGSITLLNKGTVTFSPGSLDPVRVVTLSATQLSSVATDFKRDVKIFGATRLTRYEINIYTGGSPPTKDTQVMLNVTPAMKASLPNDAEIKLFVPIYEDGGDEVLDQYQQIDSTITTDGNKIIAAIPPEAFTDQRIGVSGFGAIMILGYTRTATAPTRKVSPIPPSSEQRESLRPAPRGALLSPGGPGHAAAAAACEGSTLSPPLASDTISSPFNGKTHFGTDYTADDGTDVSAMADGTVETIGFDSRPLKTPDPRSGKKVKGWGKYIVLRHTDGSKSLYAHLESASVKVGEVVDVGTVIAKSDNTGGSSGPHLHVEYAPNGQIYQRSSKVNVADCIGSNITGSVTVKDNGTLADDAFSVSINGIVVCKTAIGQSNTCAVGNLKAGTVTLTLTAIIAPDDVGTYQIDLGSGLTFVTGGTTRSGTLPQGGSVSFLVNVPAT